MEEHPNDDADADAHTEVTDAARATDTPAKVTRRLTRNSAKNRVRLLARAVYLRVAREEAWQLQRDRTESLGLRAAVAALEMKLDELAARTGVRHDSALGSSTSTPRLADFCSRYEAELRGGARGSRHGAEALLRMIGETPESLAPLLDIECGRGEWLQLLRDRGCRASGVSGSETDVRASEAAGIEVHWAEPLDHLAGLDSASLGAATALNILELVDTDPALELLAETRRVLRPGGVLVIVTIDPSHPEALARVGREPRVRRVWHPDLLALLVRHCGFDDGRVVSDGGQPDYVLTARAGS